MPRQADSRFDEIYKRHRDDVTLYVQRRMAADAVADLKRSLSVGASSAMCRENRCPWLYAAARKLLANHDNAIADPPGGGVVSRRSTAKEASSTNEAGAAYERAAAMAPTDAERDFLRSRKRSIARL